MAVIATGCCPKQVEYVDRPVEVFIPVPVFAEQEGETVGEFVRVYEEHKKVCCNGQSAEQIHAEVRNELLWRRWFIDELINFIRNGND